MHPISQVCCATPFLSTVCSCSCALGIDPTLQGAALISDAIRRSSKAHLYHFYGVLCDIASVSTNVPSMWIKDEKTGEPVELNARELARQSLREMGKEMGVEI